jgi:uncharacterized protein (DUF1330 family)
LGSIRAASSSHDEDHSHEKIHHGGAGRARRVKASGGVYLVRSTNIERIEGAAPKRLLITKWDNIDKLTAWRVSEAYLKTLPLLDKAAKSVRSYAVEGVN